MPLPLRTERLLLRRPTLDDLDAWHAVYLDAEEVWYGAPRSSIDENREKLVRQIAHHEERGFGFCAPRSGTAAAASPSASVVVKCLRFMGPRHARS